MSILWRSKIAYRQKGALGAIFGLVVFTMVVAIVRAALTTAKGKPMNLPWVFVWTLVEANTGMSIVLPIPTQPFTLKVARRPMFMLGLELTIIVAIIVACVGSFRTLYVQHREKQKPEKSSYKMTSARNGRSGTTLPTVGTTVGGFETLGSEEALDRQEPSSTVERDKL
jgi:H+/gluconate symporter-like permease